MDGTTCGTSALRTNCCHVYQPVCCSRVLSILITLCHETDSFFADISQRFNKKQKVAAVDVDIFVNCLDQDSQVEEAEHVLYHLRRTRRTLQTLESTHHAVCRFFIRVNAAQRLLTMIKDPVQFGIFPDSFCFNIMIDHFLAEGMISEAAHTSALYMLQEDFSNPLTNLMAVHAVLQFLQLEDRPEWYPKKEETAIEDVDEDEIEHIRIPFLRNPFFDDHFDLTETSSLCGKTLFLIGLRVDGQLGANLQLLGLSLFRKWTEATKLLHDLSRNGDLAVCSDLLASVSKVVDNMDAESADKPLADAFHKSLESVPTNDRSIASLVTEKLSAAPQMEREDGDKMSDLFGNWIKEREIAVKRQMDDLVREQRIKEIIAKRQELHDEERHLFFFENLNKHELELQEAEKKLAELQASSQVEEEYVPPKVSI